MRALPIAFFKQGNRDDPNNYRPVSDISFVAQVFERIIYDQLYSYLEIHDIICKYQSRVFLLLTLSCPRGSPLTSDKCPEHSFGREGVNSTTVVSVIFRGPYTNVFHQWFLLCHHCLSLLYIFHRRLYPFVVVFFRLFGLFACFCLLVFSFLHSIHY